MQNQYKKTRPFLAILWMIVFIFGGCKKLVDVNPPTTMLSGSAVFTSDATAIAAITGIYATIMNSNFPGGAVNSLSYYGGLSADEFTLLGGSDQASIMYYTNTLTNNEPFDFWNVIYPSLYTVNSAIEGLNASAQLTPAVKQQLLGEAEFMRAFFYFYLVNLYGDVALVTTTDYKTNNLLKRSPAKDVYKQIIADLTAAQNLLSPNYLDGTLLKISADRLRPNKGAASALLARVYLFSGDYIDAEVQATSVINNSAVYSLSSTNTAFLRASSGNNEAIWQLQPVQVGQNTPDALIFVIPSVGPSVSNPVYLSNNLVGSFETGDQRLLNWVGNVSDGVNTYYFPYKYKNATIGAPVTEHEMVMRLGEQYLIRAEARALQNNFQGSAADLNVIRNRAGLPNSPAATSSALLTAILHERQVELFSEWGNRWLDLKRTGSIDQVMTSVAVQKGGSWSSFKQLYPVPLTDLQTDPNLTQNTGY